MAKNFLNKQTNKIIFLMLIKINKKIQKHHKNTTYLHINLKIIKINLSQIKCKKIN